MNSQILLQQMDRAFAEFYQEAEKLSNLLSQPQNPSSWTLYSALQKQRIAEAVALGRYRAIQEELFGIIEAAHAQPSQ